MTLRDGQLVSYVGYPEQGLAVGDHGRVLSAAGSGGWVQWDSGGRVGRLDLVADHDLVATPAPDDPGPAALSARAALDDGGAAGLLSAMADSGCLHPVEEAVDAAVAAVSARMRSDEVVGGVLAGLDGDEREEFLRQASLLLIRDALDAG